MLSIYIAPKQPFSLIIGAIMTECSSSACVRGTFGIRKKSPFSTVSSILSLNFSSAIFMEVPAIDFPP